MLQNEPKQRMKYQLCFLNEKEGEFYAAGEIHSLRLWESFFLRLQRNHVGTVSKNYFYFSTRYVRYALTSFPSWYSCLFSQNYVSNGMMRRLSFVTGESVVEVCGCGCFHWFTATTST